MPAVVIPFKPAKPRRRPCVTLIDRGRRVKPRFALRRTLPDGSVHPKPDETFDDPVLAEWCAATAAAILGYRLLHRRGGRDD